MPVENFWRQLTRYKHFYETEKMYKALKENSFVHYSFNRWSTSNYFLWNRKGESPWSYCGQVAFASKVTRKSTPRYKLMAWIDLSFEVCEQFVCSCSKLVLFPKLSPQNLSQSKFHYVVRRKSGIGNTSKLCVYVDSWVFLISNRYPTI